MSDDSPPLSKTRRKARMHALQDLGERLVDLDHARLAALDLPERLVDAVVLARSIRKHEARRRQMQYIGKLMREVEPEPIAARLAEWDSGPAADRALHAATERWRERLLAEPQALADWRVAQPGDDVDALASLLARARAERAAGDAPRAYRLVYRHLRERLAKGPGDGAPASLPEPGRASEPEPATAPAFVDEADSRRRRRHARGDEP